MVRDTSEEMAMDGNGWQSDNMEMNNGMDESVEKAESKVVGWLADCMSCQQVRLFLSNHRTAERASGYTASEECVARPSLPDTQ